MNRYSENRFEIIYEREEFKIKTFGVSLRQFFFENNLHNTFSETFKLLIVTTIRVITAEAERFFKEIPWSRKT